MAATPIRAAPTGRKAVAAALGICVGGSGLDHGLFEVLQGNAATPGLVVQAIGPAQRMWIYGTEEAFTIIPDFLLTGILALLVGSLTIIWSVRWIDRPDGSRVLLLLGGLLFLVGGGIGMLVFLLAGWLAARRIDRPLRWLPSRLPGSTGSVLQRSWPLLVVSGLALYALALEVAIVGFVPRVADPDAALSVCWLALLGALACIGVALVGASVEAPAATEVRSAIGAPGASTR